MGVAAILVLLLSSAPGQRSAAALPHLPIDTYPPAMRAAVGRAYDTARARPTDATAAGSLGRVLHAWEQWDGAHDAYARAAALAPQVFEWPYLDGCVLQRLARHSDAAAQFTRALAITPAYLPARLRLAEAHFEAGRIDHSTALFTALLREPAARPQSLFGLGRIDAAQGRHEAAVAHLRQALALFQEWGAAHYALALSLRALDRRDEAQRALERHAEYGARWPAVEDRVLAAVSGARDDPGVRARQAQALAKSGNVAGAIAAYEAALAQSPRLGLAHEQLIGLYGLTGNWAMAETHYKAAVALGANLADVHYDFGVLLGMQEQWDRAGEAYRLALSVNPMHAQAANNLGQVIERTGRFDDALRMYRVAIESQPAFRLARFNAGRALVALGRPREAIPEFERISATRDAESPRYQLALAIAHVRAGDKENGLRVATMARGMAVEFGQSDLVATIDRQIAMLK